MMESRIGRPHSGREAAARRATIDDVARRAGVSVATVDRVLNQRQAVREGTARLVLQAAEALGYHATPLLRRRLDPELPARTLGFLLQKPGDPFYLAFAAALTEAARDAPGMRGRAIVEYVTEISPAAIVAGLREIGRRADAVAVVAVDHPHISEAVAALRARGVPTVALLSDLSAEARAGHVGLDQRRAGRSAAWALARTATRPGTIGVMVGSHRFLGHELAEISFRSYFREHAPAFRLLDASVNLEDDRIAYETTVALLARHDDLVGIYCAGGGMDGTVRALRDEGAGGRVGLVCNELTPQTRAGLIDGLVTMVIATPLETVARHAVAEMARALAAPEAAPPGQVLVPLALTIAENV